MMAKKKDTKKDKKASRTDTVRSAVDQAFQATAQATVDAGQLTRGRAHDRIVGFCGQLRRAAAHQLVVARLERTHQLLQLGISGKRQQKTGPVPTVCSQLRLRRFSAFGLELRLRRRGLFC